MAARTVDVCSHRVSRKGNSHSQIKMSVEEFRKLAQRYSHRLILLWGLVMMGGLGMLHYRYLKGEKYACEQPRRGKLAAALQHEMGLVSCAFIP